jgi:hypothetical protein
MEIPKGHFLPQTIAKNSLNLNNQSVYHISSFSKYLLAKKINLLDTKILNRCEKLSEKLHVCIDDNKNNSVRHFQ